MLTKEASTQDIARIATAIRQAIVNDGPSLLHTPGRQLWGILLVPSSGTAVVYLPNMLAYLAIHRSRAIRTGLRISYQRLVALLALELPVIGDPGKRIRTFTIRSGTTELVCPRCCIIRISDLPWVHIPIISEVTLTPDHDAGEMTIPDVSDMDLITESAMLPSSSIDIGARPFSTEREFYSAVVLQNPLAMPMDMRKNAVVSMLLRHRNAERTRCLLLGHAIPEWLSGNSSVESYADSYLDSLGTSEITNTVSPPQETAPLAEHDLGPPAPSAVPIAPPIPITLAPIAPDDVVIAIEDFNKSGKNSYGPNTPITDHLPMLCGIFTGFEVRGPKGGMPQKPTIEFAYYVNERVGTVLFGDEEINLVPPHRIALREDLTWTLASTRVGRSDDWHRVYRIDLHHMTVTDVRMLIGRPQKTIDFMAPNARDWIKEFADTWIPKSSKK